MSQQSPPKRGKSNANTRPAGEQHEEDNEDLSKGKQNKGKQSKVIDNYEQATRPLVAFLMLCPFPYGDVLGWIRHLVQYATKEFGDVGAALTRADYYDTYRAPRLTMQLDSTNDPDGFLAAKQLERIKREEAEEFKAEENKLKCFSFIIGQLSIESEEVVKSHKEYIANEATIRRDPLLLLKIISITHAPALVAPSAKVAIRQTLEGLTQLRQRESETLEAYKIRYESKVSELKLLQGNQFALSADMQVHQYISGIDRRKYDAFIKWIDRGSIEGRDYPDSITKVLDIARQYKWTEDGPPKGHVQAVYGTQVPGNRKANKSEKPNAKFKQSGYPCPLCEQLGHSAHQCPKLSLARDAIKSQDSSPPVDKETKSEETATKKVHAARAASNRFSYDDSDDDLDHHVVYMTREVDPATDATESVTANRVVVLDNCADFSVFNNSQLLTNVRESDKPVIYEGVVTGQSREVRQCGDYHGVTVFLDEQVPKNILSQHDIEMCNIDIEHHKSVPGKKTWITWTTTDGYEIDFRPRGKNIAFDCDDGVSIRNIQCVAVPPAPPPTTQFDVGVTHDKMEASFGIQELYEIDHESPLLSVSESSIFRKELARLTYLSRFIRGDVIPAVLFFTTRAQEPTQQDAKKLLRVKKYIALTSHPQLRLETESGELSATMRSMGDD